MNLFLCEYRISSYSLLRQLFFFEFIKASKFHIVSSLSFPLCNENLNSFLTRWGNYSRRGNYSREETIWGRTVSLNGVKTISNLTLGSMTEHGNVICFCDSAFSFLFATPINPIYSNIQHFSKHCKKVRNCTTHFGCI